MPCPLLPSCGIADIHFHIKNAFCIARYGNGGNDIIVSLGIPGPKQFETGRVELLMVPLTLDGVHLVPVTLDDEIHFTVICQSPVLDWRLMYVCLQILENNVLP